MDDAERKPLQDYPSMQYSVHFLADPDGGYVAIFPDLPVGIHQASLGEVVQYFGRASARRILAADRLQRLYSLASGRGAGSWR